jgi:hypothetical protein
MSCNLNPVVVRDLCTLYITHYLDNNTLAPLIVHRRLYLEQRELCQKGQEFFAWSWSLDYTLLALAADFLEPNDAVSLAFKANQLLEAEITGNMITLGSIIACLLLCWRDITVQKPLGLSEPWGYILTLRNISLGL